MELHMATTDVYRFVGNASFATNMYQVTLAFQSNLPGNPLPADIATVAEDVRPSSGLIRSARSPG